ncbi:MAG: hypothetical protein E7K36_19160 [Bacteroides sp.]|nr:hypothetical protein [Bacteroides sp.]
MSVSPNESTSLIRSFHLGNWSLQLMQPTESTNTITLYLAGWISISGEAGEDRSFGQKDFPVGPFFYQLLDLFPFTVLAGHCYEQKKDKDCAFHI